MLLFSYLSFYLSLWGVCLFATEKKEAVFFFSLLIKKSGFFLSFFFTLLQSREPLRDVLDDLRRVIIPRLLVEEVAGHDQREDGGAEGAHAVLRLGLDCYQPERFDRTCSLASMKGVRLRVERCESAQPAQPAQGKARGGTNAEVCATLFAGQV